MKYRREIDGLRAVAVIPVILFHAGFKSFSGGFVGVDVFFVISGYLITSIILKEKYLGTFTLFSFYERRARRILPALFTVILTCLPFAWLWMMPQELKAFGRSLTAVSLFVSNVLFWRETSYFGIVAELKPLIHTWSLAVEEQYYLIFPIFILMTWRFGVRCISLILIITFVLSLVAAQWASSSHPSANFFLLPTRGWELLIGVFIALLFSKYGDDPCNTLKIKWQQSVRQSGSIGGLVLILYSIFVFNETTPFPSLYALVPTIGTALIIVFATPQTWIGRFLGNNLFVGVGLISYSAYLWHQPLFAFARIHSLAPPQYYTFLLLTIASIGLAYLSWRFIEMPFRNKQKLSRNTVFSFATFTSLSMIGLGVIGYSKDGFPSRFSVSPKIIESFSMSEREHDCFDKIKVHERDDWLCDLGNQAENISFFVFGDSHALALLPSFDEAAKQANQRGVITGASGCPPLLGVFALRSDQSDRDCYVLNRRVFEFIKQSKITKIFLVARWTYYTDGGYEQNDFSHIGKTKSTHGSLNNSRDAFKAGIEQTFEEYLEIGVHVYLVEQIPQQICGPKNVYYKLSTVAGGMGDIIKEESVNFMQHQKLQQYVTLNFAKYRNRTGITILSLDDVFLHDGKFLIGTTNQSFYSDDDHLSKAGALLTVDKLLPYILEK